jgi:hypothetical protein
VREGRTHPRRSHLEGDDASRELVVELERLDRATSLELVEPVTDAVHRAAEGIAQLPRVAVMVAVREQQVVRPAVLLEPAEAPRWDHRVDQHALGGEVGGADLDADALPECLPVPKTRGDLLHGRSVPRLSAYSQSRLHDQEG